MKQPPEMYIVACTDLHAAMGPYLSMKQALKVAKRATNEDPGQCVYMPVPFLFEGEMIPAPTKGKAIEDYKGGQYL